MRFHYPYREDAPWEHRGSSILHFSSCLVNSGHLTKNNCSLGTKLWAHLPGRLWNTFEVCPVSLGQMTVSKLDTTDPYLWTMGVCWYHYMRIQGPSPLESAPGEQPFGIVSLQPPKQKAACRALQLKGLGTSVLSLQLCSGQMPRGSSHYCILVNLGGWQRPEE